MLDAYLRVVTLARIPEDPELPSLAGLTNLHSEKWGAERVMDARVHEAIHALIAKMEFADGLFSTYRKAQGIAAISPWSGRQLPLRTFVHACLRVVRPVALLEARQPT